MAYHDHNCRPAASLLGQEQQQQEQGAKAPELQQQQKQGHPAPPWTPHQPATSQQQTAQQQTLQQAGDPSKSPSITSEHASMEILPFVTSEVAPPGSEASLATSASNGSSPAPLQVPRSVQAQQAHAGADEPTRKLMLLLGSNVSVGNNVHVSIGNSVHVRVGSCVHSQAWFDGVRKGMPRM